MNITVLGTPEHEGRICGRAFELVGATPSYVLEGLPGRLDEVETPDVVLVSREWSTSIRAAVARARRREIPVVYLMDGIIEWSYIWNNLSYVRPEGTVLQPMLASHLCAIGRHPARILAGLGLGDRLHIVGMPRLDGLDRRRIVGPAVPPSIVVTTARTPAHNVEQKVFVRRALRDLKRWFDAHPFVRPVWRIAPELAAELGIAVDDTAPLLDVLRQASALVSFASTTLLEGMLLGVPTALIDYRTVPQYVETAWEIRSADHLDSTLHDLLYPRPERLALQDWCLREELEPGDASVRVAEVLRKAAEGAPAASSQPCASQDFGRLDYRQVHSELSAFSVSPMSVLQYELDATSNMLDFAMPDLVHLRAEVTRLQDEVTRLQTEAIRLQGEFGTAQMARQAEEALRVAADARSAACETSRASSEGSLRYTDEEFARFRQRVYVDRLRAFVRSLVSARVKRITVYGAGDVGRALVALCREHGISVARMADRDAALWGRTIEGVEVTSIEACRRDRSPVVVLASFSHAREMKTAVRQALHGKSGVRIFAPRPWRL